MISDDQLQHLHDSYLELLRLETEVFGVKPTEVRHLIGRLGEFHCALQVKGSLAHQVNQHGFDVICGNDRRISVKTTAQLSGFVPIARSTAEKVDDLMVIQYRDGQLHTLYYGPLAPAIEVSSYYKPTGNYELSLAKARKLEGY